MKIDDAIKFMNKYNIEFKNYTKIYRAKCLKAISYFLKEKGWEKMEELLLNDPQKLDMMISLLMRKSKKQSQQDIAFSIFRRNKLFLTGKTKYFKENRSFSLINNYLLSSDVFLPTEALLSSPEKVLTEYITFKDYNIVENDIVFVNSLELNILSDIFKYLLNEPIVKK